MRIVHLSDTHLGAAAFNVLDPRTGRNLREQDFYEAFQRVVEAVCKTKPDLVLHAGDLFDAVRPPNRAITEAIEGFRRILDAGIPLAVAAGNHETPRLRSTGNIFRALQAALPRACLAFDGECRRLEAGGAVVHAVGDAPTEEELQKALESVRPEKGKTNILVLHAGLTRLEDRVTSGEYNQHAVPRDRLSNLGRDFDYLALGHYHRPLKVDGIDSAWYSGATERTSIEAASITPGYLEIELPPLRVRQVPIEGRAMIDFPPLPCEGLSAREVMDRLRDTLEGKIQGAIVRVILDGLEPAVAAELPPAEIAALRRPALDCQIEFRLRRPGRRPGGEPLAFQSLPLEFERFLDAYAPGEKFERAPVKALGLKYLGEVLQEGAGTP